MLTTRGLPILSYAVGEYHKQSVRFSYLARQGAMRSPIILVWIPGVSACRQWTVTARPRRALNATVQDAARDPRSLPPGQRSRGSSGSWVRPPRALRKPAGGHVHRQRVLRDPRFRVRSREHLPDTLQSRRRLPHTDFRRRIGALDSRLSAEVSSTAATVIPARPTSTFDGGLAEFAWPNGSGGGGVWSRLHHDAGAIRWERGNGLRPRASGSHLRKPTLMRRFALI